MKINTSLVMCLVASVVLADESTKSPSPAPTMDRVEFPKGYVESFQVLRTVIKTNEHKVVTIYGNQAAASVTNAAQLPYPYGSIIVMETANISNEAQARPVLDAKGSPQKAKVTGLHVMRREKDFGQAYEKNRAGEWEFVEYAADGAYITPPQKSGACAECHVKATPTWDYVFRGRVRDAADR